MSASKTHTKLRDIAQHLGCSVTTVSNALNAGMVLERLRNPDRQPVHHFKPTRLVIRDSVAGISPRS